jgi:hypothetical protein
LGAASAAAARATGAAAARATGDAVGGSAADALGGETAAGTASTSAFDVGAGASRGVRTPRTPHHVTSSATAAPPTMAATSATPLLPHASSCATGIAGGSRSTAFGIEVPSDSKGESGGGGGSLIFRESGSGGRSDSAVYEGARTCTRSPSREGGGAEGERPNGEGGLTLGVSLISAEPGGASGPDGGPWSTTTFVAQV